MLVTLCGPKFVGRGLRSLDEFLINDAKKEMGKFMVSGVPADDGKWPTSLQGQLKFVRGTRVRLEEFGGEVIITGYHPGLGKYQGRVAGQILESVRDMMCVFLSEEEVTRGVIHPEKVDYLAPHITTPLPVIDDTGAGFERMRLLKITDRKPKAVTVTDKPSGSGDDQLKGLEGMVQGLIQGIVGEAGKKKKPVMLGQLNKADGTIAQKIRQAAEAGDELDADDLEEALEDAGEEGDEDVSALKLLGFSTGDLREKLGMDGSGGAVVTRKTMSKLLRKRAIKMLSPAIRKHLRYKGTDVPGPILQDALDVAGDDFIGALDDMDYSKAPFLKPYIMNVGCCLQVLAGIGKELSESSPGLREKLTMVGDTLAGLIQFGTTEVSGELDPRTRKSFLMTGRPSFVSIHRARRHHRTAQAGVKMNVSADGVAAVASSEPKKHGLSSRRGLGVEEYLGGPV